MQSMKFKHSEDGTAAVAQLKRSWSNTISRFTDLSEHWEDMAKRMLKLAITISLNEQDKLQFSGRAFDKDFTAKLTSTIVGDQLLGKVTVITPDPVTGRNRMACSFFISPDGTVTSDDGAQLLSLRDDNEPSYRLFCLFIETLAAA